jgi:hypothetical protein
MGDWEQGLSEAEGEEWEGWERCERRERWGSLRMGDGAVEFHVNSPRVRDQDCRREIRLTFGCGACVQPWESVEGLRWGILVLARTRRKRGRDHTRSERRMCRGQVGCCCPS